MEEPIIKFVNRVKNLPPSPKVLVKLLEVSHRPDQDVEQVVQMITHDPSLTAEVLKRCNSAFFGSERPAGDMFEAVTRLGFQEVYNTVVALFANDAILHPGYSPHVEILWRHSVAVGVGAGVLAEIVGDPVAHAFTAGLLHEVGKVVMISANAASYTMAVQDAAIMKCSVLATEKNHFGFDHTQLGECLLQRWKLPPDITAAVRHHHCLEGAEPFQRLAAEVHLANLIAHATADKFTTAPENLESGRDSMGVLQLSPETVASLIPTMQKELEKARSLSPS